jgi:hypothetical protein
MKKFTLEKTVPIRIMLFDATISRLEIKDYTFTFSLMTDPTGSGSVLEAQVDQNISFTKIMFFLEGVLDETIMYSIDDAEKVKKSIYGNISNNLMIVPDSNEGIILALLHMKLNTICQEHSTVEKVKLMDTSDNINYELTCDDLDLEDLPSIQDWNDELSMWDQPWWFRDDPLTWDIDFESKEDLEKFKESFGEPQFIKDFADISEQVRNIFIEQLEEKGFVEKTEKGTLIEIDFSSDEEPKPQKWTPKVV